MPIITTLQEIEKEFEERFTPDWWMGFGATEDINKLGIDGIKFFLIQSHIRLLESLKEELPKEDKTKYCGAKEHEDGTVCTSCENGLSNCDRVEAARQHNNLLSTTHQLIDNAIKSIEV